MKKNKKAIAFGIEGFVALIIVLVVAVLLFLYVQRLNASTQSSCELERAICRSSAIQQSLALHVSNDLINTECPTYQIKFFENHVEKNGKTISVFDAESGKMVKKFKHLNEDIVNQVVAHELECCWYQFLEGKKRLFSLRGWFSPGSILPEPIKQGPRLCYLCAEISFDESVQQEQFSGFYQYTKDTNMRDSDRTYFNYYAEEPRISGHTEDLAEDIGLNDWQTYFLLFVAGYLEWRPNSFPYFSESPDFNFLKYKNYAVTFIKRGKASKGEELDPFGFAAHTESYFAYVFPVNALPHICSVFKRGAVE